ncbi:MAG TPA: lipopolysaccharide kinase InaA family protein, partial [Burkholderiaceae bacterium]|nr:lipopolysaccharide kinase InaA family protein [Burkholderiaceae bacterium]
KRFEDDHNLSRELSLLNDLAQRGAPVPKVLATDHRALTIEMEHRGQSLAEWVHERPDDEVVQMLSPALAAFDRVARLGVFHLDVAARNVLLESPSSRQAQVIDFSAALCARFPLQKPLWLRVNPSIHHPELARAIEADWRAFFEAVGLPVPENFVDHFDIPWDRYAGHWPSSIAANSLNHQHALLAYGLAGLLDEVGATLTSAHRSRLAPWAQVLRACQTQAEAQKQIAAAIRALGTQDATPMPTAVHTGGKGSAERGSADASPASRASTSGQMNDAGRPGAAPAVEPTAGAWPPSAEPDGCSWQARALLAALPVAGFIITDQVYTGQAARLGDMAFYSALATIPVLMLLLASLAQTGGLNLQRVCMLVLAVLQFMLARDLWPQVGPLWAGLTLLPGSLGVVGIVMRWRRSPMR